MIHVTGFQDWLHIGITCYSLKVGRFFTIWAKNSGVGSLSLLTRASPVAQSIKNMTVMQETQVWSLSWEDTLGKEKATHSRILAWETPWTEEPCGLQFMGQKDCTWLSDKTTVLCYA